MKNKEIEYLLNEMRDTTQDYIGTNGCKYQDLLREEIDLLLLYIEQLEKENQQLKKQKDDVVNLLKIKIARFHNEEDYYLTIEDFEDLLRMLGEKDD